MYFSKAETELTPKDPGWIGAWWLGFLIIAVALLGVAYPTAMFPKRLPDAPKCYEAGARDQRAQSESSAGGEHQFVKMMMSQPKGIFTATRIFYFHSQL